MPPLPPQSRLESWAKGDKLVAAKLQQPVDALRDLFQFFAALQDFPGFRPIEMWPGVVVAAGPNGEDPSNYQPYQYFVQKSVIRGATAWGPVQLGPDNSGLAGTGTDTGIYLASNLPDIFPNTTSLVVGANVWVIAYFDSGFSADPNTSSGGPQNNHKHYLIIGGGGGESTGQYQGQARMMGSQNQAVWDFYRAHAMIG